MVKKLIFFFFVLGLPSIASGSMWEEDVNEFVGMHLKILRSSRSHVKRDIMGIGKATEILDFITRGINRYGVSEVANSQGTAELVVDVSDVINLQSPDFKSRYDIFVEQWIKKGDQKPFSLFTFDRIAQAFKYREDIFNIALGSPYSRFIEVIFKEEVPSLSRTIHLIRDLEMVRKKDTGSMQSHRGYGFFYGRSDEEQKLFTISEYLDKIENSKGEEKARWQRLIREKAPKSNLRRLLTLTSMAHDYFVLQRMEKAIDIILPISSFEGTVERQAFLAGMIQIGELATNKNLSRYIKKQSDRIPWDDLVYIRNAIEHQDENGFATFFDGIVDGTDTSVNFIKWRGELETLKRHIHEIRLRMWGGDPKATYDLWIDSELSGHPSYGVTQEVDKSPIDKAKRKKFRKTSVFKSNEKLWSAVLSANQPVTYEILTQHETFQEQKGLLLKIRENLYQMLERGEIKYIAGYLQIEKEIHSITDKMISDEMEILTEVIEYLYERLRKESVHLIADETEFLIRTIKSNLDKEDIVNICLGLLNRDNAILDPSNGRDFIEAFIRNGIDYKPFGRIYKKIHPVMHLTRKVASTLKDSSSKDMDQPTRRSFSLAHLRKTQDHLHNLAHDQVTLDYLLLVQAFTLPGRFEIVKLYGEGSKEALVHQKMTRMNIIESVMGLEGARDDEEWEPPTEENLAIINRVRRETLHTGGGFLGATRLPGIHDFMQKEMSDMYKIIHRVNLPKAIRSKPAAYLASVYSLSVGLGSFKSWLLKEPSPPIEEVEAFEELRKERNFMAHGDILREMHNIDLGKVHIEVLTGYLDTCGHMGVSH